MVRGWRSTPQYMDMNVHAVKIAGTDDGLAPPVPSVRLTWRGFCCGMVGRVFVCYGAMGVVPDRSIYLGDSVL
jgi:hypothetical protein